MKARVVVLVIVAVVVAGAAAAGTVQGSFSYDGEAVSSVFPTFHYAVARAWNSATSQWVTGSVDLAAGTYSVAGLAAGTWYVRILAGTQDFGGRVLEHSNEYVAWGSVEVGDETTDTLDLVGYYAYRITQPLDSTVKWSGSMTDCPVGPPTGDTFTFAWEAVPRSVDYRVVVQRLDCNGLLTTDRITTTDLSVEIQQGAVSGEQEMSVWVEAQSSTGHLLSVSPYVRYDNGSAQTAYFHRGDGGGGRAPHPSSSLFVPQVAHLPGVPPSYWTSDLILTNPTAAAITAILTFTPRDADGSHDYTVVTVTVPAGACRSLADVLDATLQRSGAGSLEVSPATLEVSSRISTPGAAGGSYGQGFPAVGPDQVVYLGGPSSTLGAGGVSKGASRTNLVLVETWGEGVQLTVRLLDRDGSELGSKAVTLPPYGNTQINDLVGELGGPATLADGQVTVTVTSGGGRIGAVLSVVDNGSQDPTTLLLHRR